jgi:hypothetical protein
LKSTSVGLNLQIPGFPDDSAFSGCHNDTFGKFPLMFCNAYNNFDKMDFERLLQTHCVRNISLAVVAHTPLVNSDAPQYFEVRGQQTILEFWDNVFIVTPDYTFSTSNVRAAAMSSGANLVVCDYTYSGTKLYRINGLDDNNDLKGVIFTTEDANEGENVGAGCLSNMGSSAVSTTVGTDTTNATGTATENINAVVPVGVPGARKALNLQTNQNARSTRFVASVVEPIMGYSSATGAAAATATAARGGSGSLSKSESNSNSESESESGATLVPCDDQPSGDSSSSSGGGVCHSRSGSFARSMNRNGLVPVSAPAPVVATHAEAPFSSLIEGVYSAGANVSSRPAANNLLGTVPVPVARKKTATVAATTDSVAVTGATDVTGAATTAACRPIKHATFKPDGSTGRLNTVSYQGIMSFEVNAENKIVKLAMHYTC